MNFNGYWLFLHFVREQIFTYEKVTNMFDDDTFCFFKDNSNDIQEFIERSIITAKDLWDNVRK